MHLAIIDYGAGNLRSAAKALERAAGECAWVGQVRVTCSLKDIATADKIVLPGVGAFAACMSGIAAVPGLRETLEARVVGAGVPFLGICVGMQLMASEGIEFGHHPGLDWIKGRVVRLEPKNRTLKIPQIGWNTLEAARPIHPVLADIGGKSGVYAYFVHSYHFQTLRTHDVAAYTDYGGAITAAVARDNMFGVQFHPEKSQGIGLKLLANFLNWRP